MKVTELKLYAKMWVCFKNETLNREAARRRTCLYTKPIYTQVHLREVQKGPSRAGFLGTYGVKKKKDRQTGGVGPEASAVLPGGRRGGRPGPLAGRPPLPVSTRVVATWTFAF